MWKEAVVAQFKVLFQHLSRGRVITSPVKSAGVRGLGLNLVSP
jgi:hypothetical protein